MQSSLVVVEYTGLWNVRTLISVVLKTVEMFYYGNNCNKNL